MMALVLMAGPALAQGGNDAEAEEGLRSSNQAPGTPPSRESNSPIVVELFTTADCTACIFADRLLYESMQDKNIIALSCFIKDMNSNTQTTQGVSSTKDKPMDPCAFRQWSYLTGRAMNEVTIHVPRIIVNGDEKIDTIDGELYTSTIAKYKSVYGNVAQAMMQWKDEDTLAIHLPQDKSGEKVNASVWLVRYKDVSVEKIDTGMNKGRVLRFSNVIQSIKHIAKWRGDMRSIDVDVAAPQGGKEHGGYVVLVAKTMGSHILVAGKIADYPVATSGNGNAP